MMTSQLQVFIIGVLGLVGVWGTSINWNDYPVLLKPAIADPDNDLHFGMTLAMDDNYLVIGTNFEDTNPTEGQADIDNIGTVSIFRKVSDQWSEMDRIIPSDGQTNDHFGSDVNVHNGIVIIGDRNNAIAIYKYASSTWTRDELKEESDASCGYSVDVYDDDSASSTYAAYGCPLFNTNAGKVKIYKKNSGTGKYFTETVIEKAESGATYFGDELAMYGNYLAVSSTSTVYIYRTDDSGTTWVSDASITVSPLLRHSGFYGRALSMYNERLVVATTDTNNHATIKTYKRDTSSGVQWTLGQTITESYAGVAVSMYASSIIAGFYQHTDGSTAGSVKVYTLSGDTWGSPTALDGQDVVQGDKYGKSVTAWGNYFVAGSPSDNTDHGAVYIFDSTSATVTITDVTGTISMSITMALYNSDYTTAVTVNGDGHFEVANNADVHVSIKESPTNTNFKFIVKSCYSTPSSSSSDSTKDYWFLNRCPRDETYVTASNGNPYNFKMTPFEFDGQSGQAVYLHCEIILCLDSDSTDQCTQTCSTCSAIGVTPVDDCPITLSSRRRRDVDGRHSGAIADFILASKRIVLKAPRCSNTTCPTNSKCFDDGTTPTCVCDADYVYSAATKTCTNTRVLRIEGVQLDIPAANEAIKMSNNMTAISIGDEKILLDMMKDHSCKELFDGVRLINKRQENNVNVYDVLLLHKKRTSRKTAHKRFISFLASTGLGIPHTDRINEQTEFDFPTSTKKQEKRVLKTWVSTLLVAGVICAAIFVVPMSLFIMRKMKRDDKSAGRQTTTTTTTTTEIAVVGKDNWGVDVKEEVDKRPLPTGKHF